MNLIAHPWNIVFFIGFIAYLSIRGVYARRTKQVEKIHRQIDLQERALLVFVISTSTLLPLAYLFTPFLAFADYEAPSLMPWCGVVVMFVALWLFWRSHADLGRNWSVSLEVCNGHEFVSHGVYRSIRHPMYASIFLWGIAQALLVPNWLAGMSALAPFAVMYILRTPREEEMMCQFFKQEYRDYMGRTGRLIPPIRRK